MVAVSDGQFRLLSSSNGQSGEFHKVWHSKTPEWHRFSISASQCPRISRAFLERERLAKGQRVFLQESMCQFVAGRKQVIEQKWIEEAFRGDYAAIQFPP